MLADYLNIGISYLKGVESMQKNQVDEQFKSAFDDMIYYFKKDDTARGAKISMTVEDSFLQHLLGLFYIIL